MSLLFMLKYREKSLTNRNIPGYAFGKQCISDVQTFVLKGKRTETMQRKQSFPSFTLMVTHMYWIVEASILLSLSSARTQTRLT